MRPFVIIESPYAGEWERNTAYAQNACLHSYLRGEQPFASHLLYPQFLNDSDPQHRADGIAFGHNLWQLADKIAFYTDWGWSRGMLDSLRIAVAGNRPVFNRSLAKDRREGFLPQMPLDWLDLAIKNGFTFQVD